MHSHFSCKYVPEIDCPKTFTCVECFKEEDEWVKRWIRYLKIQEYKHYPKQVVTLQAMDQK